MNQQERNAKHARTVRLRKANLCEKCGKNPVGVNQDGKVSRSCDYCKTRKTSAPAGRVTMGKLKDTNKKVPEQRWDSGFYDYRDGKEFRSFRKVVKQIIVKHGPLTTREIKSHLDEHDGTWLAEALYSLMGEIEEVGVNLVRYQMANHRRVEWISPTHTNGKKGIEIFADKNVEPFAAMD